MKRAFSCVLLTLLLVAALISVSNVRPVKADVAGVSPQLLGVAVMENITLLESGYGEFAVSINVRSSPIAEIYRDSLAAPRDADVDEEMPIPEHRVETISVGDNVTEILMPVREEFTNSIEQEQQHSLAFLANISESSMVASTADGGFRVCASGTTSPQVANVTKADSGEMWQIFIGHPGGGTLGSSLAQVMFAQLMLLSLPGEQAFESMRITRIELPLNAMLLNGNELNGLNWMVDMGGGTYLSASVSLDGESAVVLDETVVVTEQNVTAAFDSLQAAFPDYKNFQIKYSLPYLTPLCQEGEVTGLLHFSYDWYLPFSLRLGERFKHNPLQASITVDVNLNLSGHVAFNLLPVDLFETWTKVESTTKVRLDASAYAVFSKMWEARIYERTIFKFRFLVGFFPVWANLQFFIDVRLNFTAYAEVSMTSEVKANGYFKAGINWTTTDGWQGIKEQSLEAGLTGLTATIEEASFSISPGVEFGLSFLFYGIAGPFVGFEPYGVVTITFVPPPKSWQVTADFRINAGIKFAGWLKRLLRLDDWAVTLYNIRLHTWSGIWEESPPPPMLPDEHDVVLLSVMPNVDTVYVGNVVDINVTAKNNGKHNETFTVNVSYEKIIEIPIPFLSSSTVSYVAVTLPIIVLQPGENVTLAFSWNTTSLEPGPYLIVAAASVVPGEINIENNALFAYVRVHMWADINGDNKVDLYDIVIACGSYDSQLGDPNYNPLADLAPPYGIINIYDIITITHYYGKTYEPPIHPAP